VYVLLEYLVFIVKLCDRYTSDGNVTGETSTVYAVLLDWPSNGSVLLGALSSHHVSSVEMLGLPGMFGFVLFVEVNSLITTSSSFCIYIYIIYIVGTSQE